MDRLNQLRGDANASRDSTLDTSSQRSEAYLTANESSKYFSLSEVDSSFSPKEAGSDGAVDSPASDTERVISNISPIPKKTELDSFKIGEQIEAANILSGGVNIFEDNENSYDEDELVIDDAAQDGEDKELKLNVSGEMAFDKGDSILEDSEVASPSKDTEVVLQIDGKNVDAIDIGNGLYLYRKDGEEELAAVQIQEDDQQQPDIKFLKVRENAEGNLEVYEEIEIEVPKEVPIKEGKAVKNTSHIPVKDITKISEPVCNKVAETLVQTLPKDTVAIEVQPELNKDNVQAESKTEVNLNGKMMKFNESRKSPLIGTFTPMTFHSTPNKEGIPLTKTMVDLQLQPSRHSENVKKTIEVHTDNCKQKLLDTPIKNSKDLNEHNKSSETLPSSTDKELTRKLDDTLDKEVTNDLIIDKPDFSDQDSNKHNTQVDKKLDEVHEAPEGSNKEELVIENECREKAIVIDEKPENNDTDNVKKDLNLPSKLIDSSREVRNESDVDPGNLHVEILESIPKDVRIIPSEPEVQMKLKEPLEKLEKRMEMEAKANKEENKDLLKKSEQVLSNISKVVEKEINIEMLKKSEELIKSELKATKNKPEKIVCNDEKIELDDKNMIHDLNEPDESKGDVKVINDMILEKSGKQHDNSNKPSQILDCAKEDRKVSSDIKITKSENHIYLNEPLKISETSKEEQKDISDVQIIESNNQHAITLDTTPVKIIPTDSKPHTETKKSSENGGKEIKKNKDVSEKPKEGQGNVSEIIEKKNVTTAPKIENKPKNPKDMGIKTGTEFKQSDTKPSEIFDKSVKEIKTKIGIESGNILKEPKKIGTSQGNIVKNVDVELKQPNDSILSTSSTNSLKLVPDTSGENKQKDLTITAQNSLTNTPNLLPAKKINISDALDAHKKSETIKSIPEACDKSGPVVQNLQKEERNRNDTKKDNVKNKSTIPIPKPINNNKAAVPFGKWTEANRQEFLNKIKEAKVPTNTSNTKQLKQPNDLNRRDVLQKIDSKRQSSIALAKVQEAKTVSKNKTESAAFTSKSNVTHKDNKSKDGKVSPPLKGDEVIPKTTELKTENSNKLDTYNIQKVEEPITEKVEQAPVIPPDMSKLVHVKRETQRKEINNQDLIDKTIEGIINRAVTAKLNPDDPKQNVESERPKNAPCYTPVSLDEIESKMNELHGIPFVERPPHELPKVFDVENKSSVSPEVSTSSKVNKNPKPIPVSDKTLQVEQKVSHPLARSVEESDDEIIEHEPITGDSECNKNNLLTNMLAKDNTDKKESVALGNSNNNSVKEPIITENDFDKFARRNSITYENCLTVSYDGKEQHNVIQTVVEKDVVPKKMSRNEIMLAESKAKSNKHIAMRHNNVSSKIPTAKQSHDEDSYNKNYQSKVQIAYHSAMTAKRHQESPIPIIEDKPVKVVFMDSSQDFVPQQLILHGKELSPAKKNTVERDVTHNNSETMDADVVDADVQLDSKLQDETKSKSKHQRKQVLAPVEVPELELIEPRDLGLEVSPKKKRKVEDSKPEKNSKALVPKKSYLLNRNITSDDAQSTPQSVTKPILPEPTANQPDIFIKHSDPISAIDNLVKAAELLETQSESKEVLSSSNENSQSPQNTPFKRGRGRPRKYPLPDTGSTDSKSPSPVKTPVPQKKPRLIDAKVKKIDTESEDDDTSSVDSMGLVKENWTMGKINENIVCPICNKLFRSENVVFKHVKHCTGPSPNRSDSDKRSPRRMRPSQDLDLKSEESKSDIDEDCDTNKKTRKRKSKDKDASIEEKKTDVIVIEDTPVKPIKETLEKRDKSKHEQNKAPAKSKIQQKTSSLVCEFCGKTFRQLSYLVNHKLQHKNSEPQKIEKEPVHKSLFSCEVCKKEFRKLHHLVQHRIIHNPNPMSSRSSRKSSSEQSEGKTKDSTKPCEDQSAGFRCEPCDKSFRKLHHLVEHRETHDEINKKGSTTAAVSTVDTTKVNPLHNCDVCKKSFKKLQHLMEHKEHHLDTCSEKSDDKSVQSSLSTKDIIHECPLCYMVFPNEHSLNKHNINCQRKKKQSAAKSMKKLDETNEDDTADSQDEDVKISETDEEKASIDEKTDSDSCILLEDESLPLQDKEESLNTEIEKPLQVIPKAETEVKKEIIPEETENLRTTIPAPEKDNKKDERKINKVPLNSKKHVTSASAPVDVIKIPETPTPKKKLPAKEKTGATVAKRQKTSSAPPPATEDAKATSSSDDDEVRYMLNPDFVDESSEGKLFMKVRAKKRNSLQIERPNSKDLVKRRISLQHPPKIPRLKAKPIPRKSSTSTVTKSTKVTPSQPEPVPSSDSDDSDVKYSFPVTVKKEVTPKETEKKLKTKTVVEKRKSLSTIAKRKSMGKTVAKHKVKSSPVKLIRKRNTEAEHRCDCGQLFSSAALLSRHTSLAHTPPRIRRRRSSPPPPPPPEQKPPSKLAKKQDKASQDAKKTKTEPARSPKPGVATRKSSVTGDAKPARGKPPDRAWRSGPHRGVPVPDKMRKLMDKSKK